MNMTYTLQQIVEFLKAELKGDPSCSITGIGSLDKPHQAKSAFLKILIMPSI